MTADYVLRVEAHVPGIVVFRDQEGLKVAQLIVPAGDTEIGLEEVPAAGATFAAKTNGMPVELALRARSSREWHVYGMLYYHNVFGPDVWRHLLRMSRSQSLPWESNAAWQCPVAQVVSAKDAAQLFLNSLCLPGDPGAGSGGTAVRGVTLARLYYEVISKAGSGRVSNAAVPGADAVSRLRRALYDSDAIRNAVDELMKAVSRCLTHRKNGMILLPEGSVAGKGFRLIDGGKYGLDFGGRIDWQQVGPTGLAGVYECITAQLASVGQGLLGDNARLSAAQQMADLKFLQRLTRRRPLSGVDEFWAYSVRRGTGAKGDEIWLEMALPPFLLEIDSGEVLDYTEQPARVVVRLEADTYYPQYYLHELHLHVVSRKLQNAWRNFPNVGEWDSSSRTGVLCCHQRPGKDVVRLKDRKAPAGVLIRALLEAAHDTILLGYKASNDESLHHRPAALLEDVREQDKTVPYKVRSLQDALAKEKKGALFLRYAR